MKIPSRPVRLLVHLFCLLGIMSCQTRKPASDRVPAHNRAEPDPASPSDMRSSALSKEKV